jgi:hypothetical protein
VIILRYRRMGEWEACADEAFVQMYLAEYSAAN